MREKALLKCDVSEGMFPDERAVNFVDFGGEVIDMFAPDRLIRGDRLLVTILGRDNEGASWISLPSEPFNSGTVVVVKSDDLAPPCF
jgi:hypothetical protein